MADQIRVFVATPLHEVIVPTIRDAVGTSVEGAGTPEQVRAAIEGRVRYDVAVVDLSWNHPGYEYTYDGLDVLLAMKERDREAPVILAVQGHGFEHSHIAESAEDPRVKGILEKSLGLGRLLEAIKVVADGGRLDDTRRFPHDFDHRPAIHEYFRDRRRGPTAALLAAAIASGQVWTGDSLARVAGVSPSTAGRVAGYYLGPLIRSRSEIPPDAEVNIAVVHRWCGEHARYLLSWARRQLRFTPERPTSDLR